MLLELNYSFEFSRVVSNLKVTMLVVVAGVKPGNAGWMVMATRKLHICLYIHISQVQVSPFQYSWLKQQF